MELTDEEFHALYGAWSPPSFAELTELMDGLTWWVVGGWALELATGVSRPHDDVDVAVPRSDLGAVAERLSGYHLWTAQEGALKPLSWFEALPAEYEQLWVRRNAQSPWLLDLLLQPVEHGEWVYKKDARIRLPLSEAVVTTGAVPHLAPQVALLHKAHLCRPKDDADLAATWPLLTDDQRTWLRDAIALGQPSSPWNARLAG